MDDFEEKKFGSKGKTFSKFLTNTLVSEYSMQFYYFEKKTCIFQQGGGEEVDPPLP